MTDQSHLRPAPPPREVNTRRIVYIGMAVFAVAGIVLLFIPGFRSDPSLRVWLWTCLTGDILGAMGLSIMYWQDAARARGTR